MRLTIASACLLASFLGVAEAQTRCDGSPVTGVVVDVTSAIVPGAQVSLDGGSPVASGADGRFEFACVGAGTHSLHVTAESFAGADVKVTVPLRERELRVTLQLATVETTMNVGEDSSQNTSPTATGATQTISGDQLATLADDPDDLLLQLQQLAAASGGSPANTTISVDGFQDSSKLPPKSSIAYIKVNPDLFSAEYREPPFGGGRVEVYTKAGQSIYHGALFTTNGSSWMNARDPFSVSKAPLGKQRYGFELSGPVQKQGSDFTMTLEHRSIDNFAVVNAVTLDGSGNEMSTISNVATPQRLWVGTAKTDWQLGAKNTFIVSYSANVNSLQNVGVGGVSLAESGYDSGQFEHVLRLTDVTTASAKLMHEARLSFKWDGETDTPVSSTPQVQVAGAFTGGGATLGDQRLREFEIECDDDAILSTKKHLLKFGTQFFFYDEHKRLTTNFNGTYTFGGGTAPVLDANGSPVAGQTETITGLEQYRRAQLGLAGGAATAFSNVQGAPEVDFSQVAAALFIQDDWKVLPTLHVAVGLRYYLQTNIDMFNAITPRIGISWSPNQKSTWTVHGHAGMFSGNYGPGTTAELRRMDGVERTTSTVYNPVYGSPFVDATPILSLRTTSPHLNDMFFAIENIGVTKTFPHGWNVSADLYAARIWNYLRSRNINSPLNDSPTGPRPGPANVNILQVQNSGQGGGNVQFFSVEQHSLKRFQVMAGVVRVNVFDNTNDGAFFTPQSSNTDAGEFARRAGNGLWQVFSNATLKLPYKIVLNDSLNMSGRATYNITTGFDNNGDGDFNDRPQFARAGDPNAIATPFGLLVASGGVGSLSRDKGIMPWTAYLNANIQRTFTMTRDAKDKHQQTLVVNVRSANALNHTNVTGVGGVLGSPLFGLPYTADNGRRVEAGLRYNF